MDFPVATSAAPHSGNGESRSATKLRGPYRPEAVAQSRFNGYAYGHLTLKAGDFVTEIIEVDDDEWLSGVANDKRGLFPRYRIATYEELMRDVTLGISGAQRELGCRHFEGDGGVKKDETQSVHWFTKAAENGHPVAQYNLAICHHHARGVEVNPDIALKWFRLSAQQGNAAAQFGLGFCYEVGRGVSRNETTAVEWYLRAAEQGNALALHNLGKCYSSGRGVALNMEKGFECFLKAAEAGSLSGCDMVGAAYYNGDGVTKDFMAAHRWFLKAAEGGFVDSQYNVALCYSRGVGVDRDVEVAYEWYLKAAMQHDSVSQYVVGRHLLDGIGVAHDIAGGLVWIRKAAEQGEENACHSLGVAYSEGHVTGEPDWCTACEWLRRSAESGNAPQAAEMLAECYALGRGVVANPDCAEAWMAVAKGEAPAHTAMKHKLT